MTPNPLTAELGAGELLIAEAITCDVENDKVVVLFCDAEGVPFAAVCLPPHQARSLAERLNDQAGELEAQAH
jgi:class 3 adenylate cyclase